MPSNRGQIKQQTFLLFFTFIDSNNSYTIVKCEKSKVKRVIRYAKRTNKYDLILFTGDVPAISRAFTLS